MKALMVAVNALGVIVAGGFAFMFYIFKSISGVNGNVMAIVFGTLSLILLVNYYLMFIDHFKDTK